MRQIILDTETTGLDPAQGHKVIEIGAVEMINRRLTGNNFHHYLNPERAIDEAAMEVHGISNEQLLDKPLFDDLAVELIGFLKGAELVIHNAPFDVGFLNSEFNSIGYGEKVIEEHCEVLDTLVMARQKHPGQKNNLNALCKRYFVDNTQRTLHGALLDAEILADVYLQMTGGQISLLGESEDLTSSGKDSSIRKIDIADTSNLRVIRADSDEIQAHDKWLELLRKESKSDVIWDQIST
jgi:DNA polymerase-3 subunit epsilon